MDPIGCAQDQPLPDGWRSAWDSTYSRAYYYNQATGERRWDHPISGGACGSTAVPAPENLCDKGRHDVLQAQDHARCTQLGNMLKVRRSQRSWTLPADVKSGLHGKPIDAFVFAQEMEALKHFISDLVHEIKFELQDLPVRAESLGALSGEMEEQRADTLEKLRQTQRDLEEERQYSLERIGHLLVPSIVSRTAVKFERCDDDELNGDHGADPSGWAVTKHNSAPTRQVSPVRSEPPRPGIRTSMRRLKKAPTSPAVTGERKVATEPCLETIFRNAKTSDLSLVSPKIARIEPRGNVFDSEVTTQSVDPRLFGDRRMSDTSIKFGRRISEGSVQSMQSVKSMLTPAMRTCRSQEAMQASMAHNSDDNSPCSPRRTSFASEVTDDNSFGQSTDGQSVVGNILVPTSPHPYNDMPTLLARPHRRTSLASTLTSSFEAYTVSWRIRIRKIVQSDIFDTLSAVLVVLNAATIGIQTDYMARHLLQKAPLGFRIIDTFFCIVFLGELILRLAAFGSKFFLGADWMWNIFDLLLVSMQVLDEIFSHIATGSGDQDNRFNFSFMRVLRILRLVRVLRVIRILRLIGDLRTIVSSISGSMKSLLWTTILIFLFVYVLAVYFTQLVLDYRLTLNGLETTSHDEQLKLYFGSLGRSVFSLYEAIAGGLDWDTLAQPLINQISIVCAFVLAGYTAFCLLALMNVVTGVFVQAALESAKQDRTSYMLRHVRELFSHADPDNTGSLNWEQFESCLDKDFMQEFFKVIDVDRSDAKNVFALLDSDDTGEINLDEFLNGCLGLHGPAKSLHLATLMYQSRITARYQAMEMEHLFKHMQAIIQAIPSLALAHESLKKPEMDAHIKGRKSFQKGALADMSPQQSLLSHPLSPNDANILSDIKKRKSFSAVEPSTSFLASLAHPLTQVQNSDESEVPSTERRKQTITSQDSTSSESDLGIADTSLPGAAPHVEKPSSPTRLSSSNAPMEIS